MTAPVVHSIYKLLAARGRVPLNTRGNAMKKEIVGLTALLSLLSVGAQAQDDDSDEYEDYRHFSYTYIEGSYAHAELDGSGPFDEDGNGFKAAASFAATDHIFLFGNYLRVDFGSPLDDVQRINGGLGLNLPLGTLPIDLVLKGGYVDFELDTDFGDIDDDGFSAAAALRVGFGDFVELEGGVTYYDLGAPFEDTVFDVNARFYITDALALQAGVEFDEELDSIPFILVGLRLEFGSFLDSGDD
jgi:hypothetical protein